MKSKSTMVHQDVRARDADAVVRGFFCELERTGYSPSTIVFRRAGLRVFLRWLRGIGVAIARLDDAVLARFLVHLRRRRTTASSPGGRHRAARAASKLFLSYLRRVSVAAPASPVAEPSLVREFRAWLVSLRCVLPRTASSYIATLRVLLERLGCSPSEYDAARIRAGVLAETSKRSHGYAAGVVRALRAWLRFLVAKGACRPGLVDAVPQIAHWRLDTLPRYLGDEVVTRVVDACDVGSALGLRDRAILLLLARLGLRAGDVVSLRCCDLNWTDATIRVCGKSRRETLLPMPQDVGDALLAYIEHGRPNVTGDHVFLRARAPQRAFASSCSISDVVRLALTRAGVHDAPSHGAHMLRHTAATAMLRAGATLEAVGTVLRHKSPDTTALYAKVDFAMLQSVTQPWPEVAPC